MDSERPTSSADEKPWYAEGLRFTCSGCGNCCTGAPGYVWVDQQEIEQLAAWLGLAVGEFSRRFVRKAHGRKSLIEYDNGDCVFFDPESRGCRVYTHRPKQCRTWPFWDSNLRSPEAWQETCRICPGSGKGQLVPLSEIEHQRRQISV